MTELVAGYWITHTGAPGEGGIQEQDNGELSGGGTNVSWAVGAFEDTEGLPSTIGSLEDWFAFVDAMKAKTTGLSNAALNIHDLFAEHFFGLGGKGADLMSVHAVNPVTMIGGGGADTLVSVGSWGDTLKGGGGNDDISGVSGADVLEGGGGRDVLRGGTEDDRLIGGKDADTLIGGFGQDKLIGGVGADVFMFEDTSDSPAGELDTLVDFNLGQGDSIDLSVIDANFLTEENETFVLVNKFSGALGEARITYSATKDVSTLMLNTGGDTDPEFIVRVAGQLTADDLVL